MTFTALSPKAVFDPELHYGDGDDNALYNLFATWPENYFSSLPEPHGNRGVDEPFWELRQSRIFLDDYFWGRRMRRLFTPVAPGPDKLETERLREQAHSDDVEPRTRITVCFRSALNFAQEQGKVDDLLALAAIFGPGKQAGVRQAGCRRQPSIRRRRLEWETISDEEKQDALPKRRRLSAGKRPAASAPSALSSSGGEENRQECIIMRV